MQSFNPRITAGVTAVILGLPVLAVGHKMHQDSAREANDRVDLVANQTALRLQDYLNSRLLSLSLMRHGMESGLIQTKEQFFSQAELLRSELSGIQALNWVNPELRITWVSPLKGNEAVQDKSVLDNPVAAEAIWGAEKLSQACMTAPIRLFQGGLGFATYFPIYADGDRTSKCEGFINGVFRSQEMLDDVLGMDLRNRFEISMRDRNAEVYTSKPAGMEALLDQGSAEVDVEILDRTWKLQIFPTPTTFDDLGHFHNVTFVLVGLGFVLAFATSVYFFLARREEHQEILEQRRLVKERMAQARKMEAVGELAGGVAHDFNNLLTAISGSASLAALDMPPSSTSGRHMKRILQACQSAAEMTSRLLTFSRTQHLDRGQCQAKQELEALHGLLSPLVRDDIQFEFQLGNDLHKLPLAPSDLGRVVLNLVTNSMEALPQGGTLRVQAQGVTQDSNGRAGNWLHICVSDTGTGMSAEVRDRVFEPFFTTKEAGGGTGLGLATAFGIVHGVDGLIQVKSELGVGTKVHVYLPMEVDVSTTQPETGLAGAHHRECNILVVEDEEVVRKVSTAILESVGHEVVAVGNGQEALEFFEQNGKVDLVFTDTFMPKVGGLELARRLREDGFQGSIIITTGYATDLSMEEVRELKASFLAKPFSRTELLSLVEYCLAKGDSA